jgi:hypothetical protein
MSEPNREEWSRRIVEPYLDKHGPSPYSEIPVTDPSRARSRGVKFFAPYRGQSGTNPLVGVAYLPTQSPEAVVQAWIDANSEIFESLSRGTVTRRIRRQYDEEWVSAWQTCAKEAGIEAHQQAPDDPAKDPKRPCPTCGEPIRARRFVKHVSECS